MRLPVDTTAVRFVAAGPPEASVDFTTKAQRVDESGVPLFQVHLFAVGGGARDVISVRVAGEPKGPEFPLGRLPFLAELHHRLVEWDAVRRQPPAGPH